MEGLIVCCLITILASIGVKGLQGMSARYRLHHAALAFVSELSALRGRAVGTNSALSMTVAPSRDGYAAARGAERFNWRGLPPGVCFSVTPRKPVTFFSRGNAAPAGSYVLSDRKRKIKIVVSMMGRVRWEYVKE